jgi:membrane-associated HD superfamily phosphohydrolase
MVRPSRVLGKADGTNKKKQPIVSFVRVNKSEVNLGGVEGKKANKLIKINEIEDQNKLENEEKKPYDYFEAVFESKTNLREREKQASELMMKKIKSLSRARTIKHVENALTKSTFYRLGAIYESDS